MAQGFTAPSALAQMARGPQEMQLLGLTPQQGQILTYREACVSWSVVASFWFGLI